MAAAECGIPLPAGSPHWLRSVRSVQSLAQEARGVSTNLNATAHESLAKQGISRAIGDADTGTTAGKTAFRSLLLKSLMHYN